jgi:hypothetical protein
MKTFFMTLVLFVSYSSFAQSPQITPYKTPPLDSNPQSKVLPKAAPGASTPALKEINPEPKATAQKQEQSPGIENKYPIGDYDKNGQYNFFDRLEREKEEADKEAEQQNQ